MAAYADDTYQDYGANEGQEGKKQSENEKHQTNPDSNCSCIKRFLDKINMPQYYDMLMQNGCDTIEIIQTLSKSDLREMGMKIGHSSLFHKIVNSKTIQQYIVCRCNQKLVACTSCYGKGSVEKEISEQFKRRCGKCNGQGKYTQHGKCSHPRHGGKHQKYAGHGDAMRYSSYSWCPDCDMHGDGMITKNCDSCYGSGYQTTSQKNMKNYKCEKCNGDGKIYMNEVQHVSALLSNYDFDEKKDNVNNFEKLGAAAIAVCDGRVKLEKVYSGYKIIATVSFPTVRGNFNILGGKYYYELALGSAGCMQLGFADSAFNANSLSGQGVGDDSDSWGYDGFRQKKWCDGSAMYGTNYKWSFGDVVGCFIDVDAGRIQFALNGVDLGLAFANVIFHQNKVYPAITLQAGQTVTVIFDKQYMKYPPAKQTYETIKADDLFNGDLPKLKKTPECPGEHGLKIFNVKKDQTFMCSVCTGRYTLKNKRKNKIVACEICEFYVCKNCFTVYE